MKTVLAVVCVLLSGSFVHAQAPSVSAAWSPQNFHPAIRPPSISCGIVASAGPGRMGSDPHVMQQALQEAGITRAAPVENIPGAAGTISVPTLQEQGIDIEFENWRSVLAPPGISRADERAAV